MAWPILIVIVAVRCRVQLKELPPQNAWAPSFATKKENPSFTGWDTPAFGPRPAALSAIESGMRWLLKRWWFWSGAGFMLVAVVAGYLMIPIGNRISQANCDKIQPGWTSEQVEKLLGGNGNRGADVLFRPDGTIHNFPWTGAMKTGTAYLSILIAQRA
jgi:hypothetical protein